MKVTPDQATQILLDAGWDYSATYNQWRFGPLIINRLDLLKDPALIVDLVRSLSDIWQRDGSGNLSRCT